MEAGCQSSIHESLEEMCVVHDLDTNIVKTICKVLIIQSGIFKNFVSYISA